MTTTADRPLSRATERDPRWLDAIAARALHRQLGLIVNDAIDIVDGDSVKRYGAAADRDALRATLTVHDARFWAEVAFGGSIGAGEAYMHGYWSADDLTTLLRIVLRNRNALDAMERGWARLGVPARRGLHWLNRNTRSGSRRNIAAHYDLGNAFFRLFLDPTLMYSCAIFERPEATLEKAQLARLDRICRKLALGPTDHLLEIGTGWGGFAIHAASRYGCRITTTTISRQQYELARERIAEAGLAHRVTVLLDDYRDLRGRYDKLVSIEMIEAVGPQFYDTYFECCDRLLKDDGAMLLQAITIADQRYEAALHDVDFIQRHIFPGSAIPSISALARSIARASTMKLVHLEDIGPHYATTLARWRDNLLRKRADVLELGYDETFLRMWEYYFCYCEAGFEERALGDVQMLLAKPGYRAHPVIGDLTAG